MKAIERMLVRKAMNVNMSGCSRVMFILILIVTSGKYCGANGVFLRWGLDDYVEVVVRWAIDVSLALRVYSPLPTQGSEDQRKTILALS